MSYSALTEQLFTSEGMRQVFSARATLQRMLDFEAALAEALAAEAVIPGTAVVPIRAACDAAGFDMEALARDAQRAGNLAIPLVKALTGKVATSDDDAARYVHWGSTSQDVIDTGRVLQLRDAIDLLAVDLAKLGDTLAALVHRYRDTPMMGRTWMQHALPITFGLKVAGWLDAVLRHQQRLHEMRERVCVLQFGGAAGTLASLGSRGLSVAQNLSRRLALPLPNLPWHAHRDRMAECATVLGLLTGTLGKIARDISLQNQTEVGELSEPVAVGRGGSSAMPHKRNPVGCATALTAATRVPGLVATMLAGMPNEHERALGGWQAEWDTLPEIASLCAAALTQLRDVAEGLVVDVARMRKNMDATDGLVMAEPVAIALAAHLGRTTAHDLIEAACHAAVDSGRPLLQVLAADSAVTAVIAPGQLAELLDPVHYTGEAAAFADRVLAAHRQSKA
jgi:3-carboxy-cis,cis-muconate cycloisomerase